LDIVRYVKSNPKDDTSIASERFEGDSTPSEDRGNGQEQPNNAYAQSRVRIHVESNNEMMRSEDVISITPAISSMEGELVGFSCQNGVKAMSSHSDSYPFVVIVFFSLRVVETLRDLGLLDSHQHFACKSIDGSTADVVVVLG
jgi:hypothetical protein